jgi:DNA-binding SARP family transcriptional activator/tetratricopeptide (TPR) repeat protein
VRTGGIEIRLLGRFAVCLDGEELPIAAFGGRLTRELLRLLLLRRGNHVSKDSLTEALWPERPPADPAANLDVLVSRARRALRDPTLILAGSGGYTFARDDRCLVDTESFLSHVEAGRTALGEQRSEPAFREFQAALDAWRGEPLPEDAYAEWAQGPRRQLHRAHLDALEGAAAAALAAGHPGRAVSPAERAVEQEPLRETSHLLLARALSASGAPAEALAVLDIFRTRLAQELGLDPSEEVARLQIQILRGETVVPPASAMAHGRRMPLPAAGHPTHLAFVGREAEVRRIRAVLCSPGRGIAVVMGHSGSGKSRLLAEVVATLEIPVLTASAFRAEQEEPWSLARSLLRDALGLDIGVVEHLPERLTTALADVLPDLEELRPVGRASFDPESRRALALEGAVRILQATGSPGVVVVDDAQWADRTSLGFLSLVARRVSEMRLLVAYRPEELARSGPAAMLLDELAGMAGPVVRVTLPPLPAAAISELVADGEIARAIIDETDCTPFAVTEVLRSLLEQGLASADGRGRWHSRTERADELARKSARLGQRRTISARIRWQPPRRTEILALMALAGREVPAVLLQRATGNDASQLLDDLDTLARVGLARAGEGGWSPAHDLVSEALVGDLEPGERARLHALLAHALQATEAEPSELARHLAAAGDATGAAQAYVLAGNQALDRYASDDAEGDATAGLELRPKPGTRRELLEIRAEARTRRGDLDAAREDLRACLSSVRSRLHRSRLLARMAMLMSGSTDLTRASEIVELALAEADGDHEARARALHAGAIVDMNAGAIGRASARLEESLGLFELCNNPRGIADVVDVRAMAAALAGRLPEAAESLGRAARLFEDCGDLIRVIWPLAARGAVLGWMLQGEDGLRDIDEALELARSLRHQEAESYCLMERSLTLTALGRGAEAVAAARGAAGIAGSIGHAEWTTAALMAMGGGYAEAGDFGAAAETLRGALDLAAQRHLAHFESWAAARLASVLVAQGDLQAAETHVTRALTVGTPFAHYEGRLAEVQLAVARGDPQAGAIAAEALALAESGGHLDSSRRLRALMESLPVRMGPASAACPPSQAGR